MEKENAHHGLSDHEAGQRLTQHGYNELPSSKPKSIFQIAFEVVREPMFLLLVACGAIYVLLGDVNEALMLLGFVFFIIGITLYQERKSERALEALRDLSSPRALVIRGGVQRRIAGREVVPGDIILLAEGDRVPADAIVISSTNLSVDESLLTGESVPVRKLPWDGKKELKGDTRPGGDGLPFVYSGTLIVQGQGIAQVRGTGLNTEMGKIGKSLQHVEEGETKIQAETREVVKAVAVGGIILCIIIVLAYGLMRGDWLNAILTGLTTAMALLPEEFPVVLTLFLALGARRMAQKNVLTRRMPAIETLGAATVLCVDKTGTLTVNKMAVSTLFCCGKSFRLKDAKELPGNFHQIIEYGMLASQEHTFDPMEKAIKEVGERKLAHTDHIHKNWELVREYPLSRELLAMSQVWKSPKGKEYVIAVKGAPEAIAELCHLQKNERGKLLSKVEGMAADGMRVIGVAKAHFKESRKLPSTQHDFDFELVGLVGLEDPVRQAVHEAVRECYQAGMRVIMITGDHPATALNIAKEAGLVPGEVMTGPELDGIGERELRERVKAINVFARVAPEQKLKIVNALKSNGEVVAMTGDGVNDAPALKAANIGIAMGMRGTDVARESAALVLLDDNFSSIVGAVRMGRRIFDNLRKAMAYVVATHIPIAGLSLIPVLLGMPLVFMPVHIVFLELIIDPACSVAFEAEAEEPDIMRRKPRDPRRKLFDGNMISVSLLQGLSVLVITLFVLGIADHRGLVENEARALTFTALVIANLGLILTNRSWSRTVFGTLRSPNRPLWIIVIGTSVFLALILNVPMLQEMFHFTSLGAEDIAMAVFAGLGAVAWFEIIKLLNKGKIFGATA